MKCGRFVGWISLALIASHCGGAITSDDGAACTHDGRCSDAAAEGAYVDHTADVPFSSDGVDSVASDVPMGCPPGPTVTDAPSIANPIYPGARYANYGTLGARAHTVCIDTSALASHAHLDALVPELLAESGLVAGGPDPCTCDLTIHYLTAPPALTGMAATTWTAAGTNADSYVVTTASTNGRATANLYAPAERAGLYALRATLALVQTDPSDHTQHRVATATIVDYPSFSWRGVVEGFYGNPYSVRDRTTVLRLMSRLRENVYIYGPKDDPYERWQWSTAYPLTGGGAGQAIQTAAHEADRLLIKFVWAISPGVSYGFSSGDYNNLIAKLNSVRGLGVSHFALFMDDTSQTNAAATAGLANQIDDWIHMHDPNDHLIMVGQRYAFGPTGYTDTLGTMLHPDIEVMWTGNDIEPATMTAGNMGAINGSLHRHVTIWDNWPNAPGSFTGRSGDLYTAVQGYYTNPVLNELGAHPLSATLQILGPVADYLWWAERYAASSGSEMASYNAWQPILSAWQSIDAPCTPCGMYFPGWTCNGMNHGQIVNCDGATHCLTFLPCPGGCMFQPNPQPDICN
jgi:hypothetical protein